MEPRKFMISLLLTILLSGAGLIALSGNGEGSVDVPGNGPSPPSIIIDDRMTDEMADDPVWSFVHFNGRGNGQELSAGIERTGAQVRRVYDIAPVISVLFSSMDQVRSVSEMEGVTRIEAQSSVRTMMDISTASIKANPSSLYSPRTARGLGMTGDGITIAIIDSGVDNEHPTLQGSFVAGVDLTLPINTPLNPDDGSFDPDDRNGHGTGVASIALGRGGPEGNYTGVAPSAGLIDIKVVGLNGLTMNQNSLMDAFQWCSDNKDTVWGDTGYTGVDIISISLGIGGGAGALTQAMDQLVGEGVVVVQSAGNSGSPYGDDSGTTWADRSIVVGAVNDQRTIDRSDDEFWSSSTYGPRTDDGDNNPYDELRPDVVAPGVSITFASSSRTSRLQGANGWSTGSGTSYSTPHVSGTVALMLQAKGSLSPTEQNNHISMILHQSSEPRGEPYDVTLSTTYDTKYGYGLLDAYEAVKTSLTYIPVNHRPEITYFAVEPNVTTAGSTCRIRAVASDVDEEMLTYTLTVDDGVLTGDGPIWDWKAPSEPGKYYFNLAVTDVSGGKDTASTYVLVEEGPPNRPPVITSFKTDLSVVPVGGTANLRVIAIDQDGDELGYDYVAERGSIQGTGDEVVYRAPSQPVRDRISVTVSDGRGGTDTSSLEIDVREEAVNSPPVITLVTLEPGVIDSNTSGERVVLYAQIDDPDGLEDIDVVIADLSSIGGVSGVEMLNNGVDPDVAAGDLEFTLELPSIADLDNGTYTIFVTVYDIGGGSDTASVKLIVDIPYSSTDVEGHQKGIGTMTLLFLIVAIVLIVIVLVAVFVLRSRSKREAVIPRQGQYPVQYQTAENTHPYQTAPKFKPVGPR
ncbi:MAG: S8 family serine peptidase [Candidatus Thermoplasmatota archaeon]|nr:S8 family serine peptidase [Candidatus Thermoplasmatota archaeon]